MNNLLLQQNGEPTKAFRWLFLLSASALAGLLSVKGELLWVAASLPLAISAPLIVGIAIMLLKKQEA